MLGLSSLFSKKGSSLITKVKSTLLLSLGYFSVETAISGIIEDNFLSQLIGAFGTGTSAVFTFAKKGTSLLTKVKGSLLLSIALFEFEVLVDIVKWATEYFDGIKAALYGEDYELDLGEFLNVTFTAIGTGFNNALENIFGEDFLQPLIDWIADDLWTSDFSIVVSNAMLIGENIISGLIEGMWEGVTGLFEDVSNIFTQLVNKVKEVLGIHSPSTVFAEIGQFIIEGIIQGLQNVFNSLIEFFTNIWESLKQKAQEGVQNIKDKVSEKLEEIKQTFTDIWQGIETKVKDVWQGIKNTVTEKIGNVKTKISDTLNSIKTTWNNIWTGLKNKVTDIFNDMWTNIKKVINKIIGGVESMANKIVDGINAVIRSLNHLKIKMPDALGGQTYGFNIAELSHVSIPQLEDGGFPKVGDLFFANEAGPEYVGSMNGKPAVANNDQIVEGIQEGTYQAMKQALSEKSFNPVVQVYIGNKKLYSGYAASKRSDSNMYGVDIG